MDSNVSRTARFDELAVEYSEYYKGKIQTIPKVPIRHLNDFSVWYTPGVAAVSLKIAKEIDLSFELTGRWNNVAIITDGTRVLGIGKVGPEAALPVMEGKGLIFNFLGGVNAIPVPIRVNSREEFIATAKALEPSFGGFNLEDIESPKCFFILEELQKSLSIPAWHDDQLGTACISLAGLYNSLKITNRRIEESKIVLMGSGAANIATAFLLFAAGAKPGNIIMTDSKGILEPERIDMDRLMLNNPWKYQLAIKTNSERLKGPEEYAFRGADIVIAASKPGPGTIKPEWIKTMSNDAIVFALANPNPEIWPDEAKAAGAKIVATGRSDFDNQVNNSLVFPGVFRGILDARAKGVNFDIMVSASKEIANFVSEPSPEKIVPSMDDWELYPMVASAVAAKTVELGLARKTNSKEGFRKTASEIIETNRKLYLKLLDDKFIRDLPGGVKPVEK